MHSDDYNPHSVNAVLREILVRLSSLDEGLKEVRSWQGSFGTRIQKQVDQVETNQKVGKGQVAIALASVTTVSAFIAWVGVMWASVWSGKH